MSAIDYHDIITIEPDKRSGKPCISGLRIDILEYFASGMTEQEILEYLDYLTQEDIRACLLMRRTGKSIRRLHSAISMEFLSG